MMSPSGRLSPEFKKLNPTLVKAEHHHVRSTKRERERELYLDILKKPRVSKHVERGRRIHIYFHS